jgi:signal transduction histidine kinase
MRERALLLGGQFVVESSHKKGTRLTAELPVR